MDDRGLSPVVGMVLLVGLTAIVAISVIVVGLSVLDGVQSTTERTQAENSMEELASTADTVASSDARSEEFVVGGNEDSGTTWVDDDAGSVSVNVSRNGTETTLMDGDLGVYRYETSDGTEIAYQGGGVWRHDDGHSKMVKAPSFQYRNSSEPTLTFPLVRIEGSGAGSGQSAGELQVANVTEQFPRDEDFSNPVEGDYLYVDVESEYCDGWERHVERRTDGTIEDGCTGDNVTSTPNELRVNMSVGNVTIPDGNSTENETKVLDIDAGVVGHTIDTNGGGEIDGDVLFESRTGNWGPGRGSLTVTGNETSVSSDEIEDSIPFDDLADTIQNHRNTCDDESRWKPAHAGELNGSDLHCVQSFTATGRPVEINATAQDQFVLVDGDVTFSSPSAYMDVDGTNNVTVYVDGDVKFDGDGPISTPEFGNPANPEQTAIVSTGDFLITGGPQFYGIAVTPTGTVTVENPRTYVEGAVLGEDAHVRAQTNVVHNAGSWNTTIPVEGNESSPDPVTEESDLYYLHLSEVELEVDS